jgi:hypothetical protein
MVDDEKVYAKTYFHNGGKMQGQFYGENQLTRFCSKKFPQPEKTAQK